jgi:hypothetical protein
MALAAEALITVADDEPPTYKCGHPRTDENTVSDVAARNGKRYNRCRTCKHDSVRRWRANNAPVATGSMVMPRPGRKGQPIVEADQTYQTRRLWRLLGQPLRDRLASIVLDDTIDPVVRRTIERAADSRAWVAASPDMASRLLVENLLAQTVDARSPRLTVDALMSLIWSR